MAEFSGNVNAAYYMNEECSLIEIVYTCYQNDPEGEKIKYMVEVSDNSADYQALVTEGYDAEKLAEQTSEYKRAHSRQFNHLVNTLAEELAEELSGSPLLERKKIELEKQIEELNEKKKLKVYSMDNEMFDFIDRNEDSSSLFKFKLWALDNEKYKGMTKENKKQIRKAKTLVEGFSILHSVSISE